MVTLRRPSYPTIRPGPGTLPGRHPAPDHREGNPHLGAAQRLHFRGQPPGHQDRDQDRHRDALQRQGRRGSHPEPSRKTPPLPGQARPDAALEEGHRDVARRIPNRLLLIVGSRSNAAGPVFLTLAASSQWMRKETVRWVFAPTIRPARAGGTHRSATLPS